MTNKTTNTNSDIRTLSLDAAHLRATTDDTGTMKISGTAIVFNRPSQILHDNNVTTRPFVEYIEPQAVDGVDFSSAFLLYAHDYNEPLARVDSGTLKISVDKSGVNFTAQLPNTTVAHDAYENIRAGNIKGCSFGFDVAPDGSTLTERSDGVAVHTVYKIAAVHELTLTPIPAYTQTSVQLQRSLNNLNNSKEVLDLNSATNSAASTMSSTASTASSASAASSATSAEIIASAVAAAVEPLKQSMASVAAAVRCGDDADSDIDRDADDVDTDDDTTPDTPDDTADDSDVDTDDDRDASSATSSAASSAGTSAEDSAASSANSTTGSSTTSSAASSTSSNTNSTRDNEGGNNKMMNITPNNSADSKRELVHDFGHYLLTREVRPSLQRDAQDQGVGLAKGGVLIPETILTAEHEEHQYPRLEDYVNHISVSTTTGKQPYFEEQTSVLQTKEEFAHAGNVALSPIKEILWNLKTYAGTLAISRDLLMDSERGANENWISEAQSQMQTLQDNTNDALISTQLQNGVTAKNATDAVADMKTVLNVNLKPKDSQQSQIVLTSSAYNALDQLKDGFGRPLLQPNPTQATSNLLFGKPVVVVDDTLFGKAGDAIAIIAPLKKAIYDFQMGQVSGQFIDNFDIFDTRLGVFLRKDVVNGRPDLVNILKLTDKSLAASNNTVATGK